MGFIWLSSLIGSRKKQPKLSKIYLQVHATLWQTLFCLQGIKNVMCKVSERVSGARTLAHTDTGDCMRINVRVCVCVCMLKSTKKYYLNDNLLLLVCLLSNVILCTAMGAVMHKPFQTKATVVCQPTLLHFCSPSPLLFFFFCM